VNQSVSDHILMWVVTFWVMTLVSSNQYYEATYTFMMEAGSCKIVGYVMALTVFCWLVTAEGWV
jgi:hypothetical protein